MRVVIDTNAVYVTQAGTSRYVRGLVRALRGLDGPDFVLSELAWPVENFEYRQPLRAFKTIYREWIWSAVVAPQRISREKADVFHRCTSLPINHAVKVKEVVTLYDLAVIRHPERYRKWHRVSEPRHLKRLSRVDRIICISRFTADEAMKVLDVPAGKLEVIYPGTDFELRSGRVTEERPGFELPDCFYLFVGSLEPGKNLALLRDAYLLAQSRGIELPSLVVVGTRWPGVAHEGPSPSTWQYVAYQADDVLCWLYRHALALVFPSRYEGFGLPVLEAMSIGCPVICSKVASVPEVGGHAVCYADLTPQAWLDAMTLLCRDKTIREDLRRSGFRQAQKFSWNRCAEETVGVYKKALNG